MSFESFLDGFKDKLQANQVKQTEKVAKVVSDAWIKSLSELIEDPILRDDIRKRAGVHMANAANAKIAELQDLELSVMGLANDFSLDRLADVIKKFSNINKL